MWRHWKILLYSKKRISQQTTTAIIIEKVKKYQIYNWKNECQFKLTSEEYGFKGDYVILVWLGMPGYAQSEDKE